MLSKNEQKLIKSLHRSKGRKETGFCLVEGEKVVQVASDSVQKIFTAKEEGSSIFRKLVTTETPQEIAAIAKIPEWTMEDVHAQETIIVLDGVQDPGNVGTIIRLCLGFDASLILVDSADPASPKVIRSSVGAMFQVPWIKMDRESIIEYVSQSDRYIYRLEKRDGSEPVVAIKKGKKIIVAGSEGSGIELPVKGSSVHIDHSEKLESLNVAAALAITLNHIIHL
ncbi:RNA methyltransferase [Patescibacteria group bacterium]|nr:RNA methyltransferase [Patescibacteria group bacterium]